jgi:hypothetical protein
MWQAFNITRESWLATAVVLANTFFTRLLGLLGKTSLANSEGLWIKPCDSIHTLGMRVPLDVIFLDRHGRVVKAIEHLQPSRLVFPVDAATSVLELAVGTIARTGTTVGDMISITEKNLPAEHAKHADRKKELKKDRSLFFLLIFSHLCVLRVPRADFLYGG